MTYIIILACLSLTFLGLQRVWPRIARNDLTLLALNSAFLVFLMHEPSLVFLAGFLAAGYSLALAARRWKNLGAGFFAALTIFLFAILKKYELLPLQPLYAHIPEILGLSYIIFRVLIIVFESRDTGKIPAPLPYLNYCISMFTFMAGPIQRYRDFSEDLQRSRTPLPDQKEILSSLARFMGGVLKVLYVAPVIQDAQNLFMKARLREDVFAPPDFMAEFFHDPLVLNEIITPALGFGVAAFIYLVYLYFDFSGYTDIVIGLGGAVGFRLPENFNKPFAAGSFLEFWTRWHISLSLWFRDYCFTPVLKRMIKLGIGDPVIATLPAYFISFGLLGVWHGRTWPFILCGLMFAAAATVNHFYRAVLKKSFPKETLSKLNDNAVYQALASALTFFYISLAITGLWLDGKEFQRVWHSFSAKDALFSFPIVVISIAACLYIGRAALQRSAAFIQRASGWAAFFNKPLYWGIITGACLWAILLPKAAAPFVYFRF